MRSLWCTSRNSFKMEILCALVVCFVLRETLTCQGKNLWDISEVLADVPNWKGLADLLNVQSDDIETNCALDIAQAACYRRTLVRRYCDYQLSEHPRRVAEDIARALEEMSHKRQAQRLRMLEFGRGHGTEVRERDKDASETKTAFTRQSLQEQADLPNPPDVQHTSEPGQTGIEAVRSRIKELRDQFAALEDITETDMENVPVHVERIVKVICSFPSSRKELHQDFLMKFAEEFKHIDTISVVLLKLDTHKYWDYLNIDILEHIITEFSLPSRTQLDTYKTQQQQFMEQTTVEQFYEAEGDRQHIDPPPAYVKLISQHEWKPPTYLKKVDEFRRSFALKYELCENAVILVGMRGGSVVITLMVPESVVAMVNSTGKKFFKKHGITHLQLNGTCVYKQTEDEVSPSAEEPSFEGQSQLFPGATALISMAETAGYGVSLTSVTNAAGPSSIESMAMRPCPLQTLETAAGNAESREITGRSISDLIQQNWAGSLIAVMTIVVSTCAVSCCTRVPDHAGREDGRQDKRGEEKEMEGLKPAELLQGPSGRQPTALTPQPTQPPLLQSMPADGDRHQVSSPPDEAQAVEKELLKRPATMDYGTEGSGVQRQMGGGKGEVFEVSRSIQNVTIQTQITLSPSQTVTSPSSIITSSPPTPSHVFTPSSPAPTPSPLTHYADYLRAVYATSPVAIDRDKWPPTPSTTYIKLALVKKEKVSRGEADHFTRLTLQGDIDTILKAKQPISMDDILKDNDTRLVVVEGAPGIGKSTLAWELCRQWRTLESLKRFSLVVLFRLREEGVRQATAISDLLYHRNAELCKCVVKEVEKREGESVLLVFDGFDEFPAELRRKSLVTELISGCYLPKATVLVTSRPSATAELLSVCQAHVGKHIEVVGFSDKEIQKYAESIFRCEPKLLASFQTYLSVNPVVRGMMYNPLNCGMVVEVYRENSLSHRPIPHTQTQLYTELSLCLLSRHLSAARDPLARKLPDNLRDIPHDSDLYQQLVRLGWLAFEGRLRDQVIFKELPEDSSTLGLLNTCSELYGRREKVTYNFLHLTLQEYLGAFFISQLPASEQRKLFMALRELRNLDVVWRFVAGLTRMQAIGWEGFKGRQMEEAGVRSSWLFGKRWVVLENSGYVEEDGKVEVWPSVVQCLYEAQDAGSCASVFGQSRVLYRGQGCTTPFDAYAVGYCISVCKNDWNLILCGNRLGPEVVEMLGCGLKSVQYGGGSIGYLTLSEDPIKHEGIKFLQQFPHEILQQIRKLDFSRYHLSQTGFDLLADAVPHLCSLESLDIFDNPGGSGSTVKLFQALGKHERIMFLRILETVIGRDDAVALSEAVQSSGNLSELILGNYKNISPECVQEMVKTVLSPSSLRDVYMYVPSSISPLDYMETISDNLTKLEFVSSDTSYGQLPAELSCCRLSDILKENKTLKELKLLIPLGNTGVRAIVESLKHNHTLTELRLSTEYRSQYFSESEQQAFDRRIKWGH